MFLKTDFRKRVFFSKNKVKWIFWLIHLHLLHHTPLRHLPLLRHTLSVIFICFTILSLSTSSASPYSPSSSSASPYSPPSSSASPYSLCHLHLLHHTLSVNFICFTILSVIFICFTILSVIFICFTIYSFRHLHLLHSYSLRRLHLLHHTLVNFRNQYTGTHRCKRDRTSYNDTC